MGEIRWIPQAFADLESITEFIARDSPHSARLFASDVIEVVERLVNFPKSGRTAPENDDPLIREIIRGNYRIVYRRQDNLVELLTVHHSARLLDPSQLREMGQLCDLGVLCGSNQG